MTMEQRLQRAFEEADRVEPSVDLWSRVLYSIEEDREHRRRVVRAVIAGGRRAVCVLVLATVASLREGPSGGRYVAWQAMELIELITLVAVAVTFAPAIRRFGRGFADDLWITRTHDSARTPAAPRRRVRTGHRRLRAVDDAVRTRSRV